MVHAHNGTIEIVSMLSQLTTVSVRLPVCVRSDIIGMGRFLILLVAVLLAGCAQYRPQPLDAEQRATEFERRSLADAGLRTFIETNLSSAMPNWPLAEWNLEELTLAAFYFHSDLDAARAKWNTATAGKITAGQRPNPNLSFTPRINSSAIGTGVTPWILGGSLEVPLETAGKRGYRLAQAQYLGEAARFELAGTAWRVRSRVRRGLLDLQAARATTALVREQTETLGRVAQLVGRQFEAGAVSPVELSGARIAENQAQLKLKDAQRQEAVAGAQLAEALGLPLRALDGVKLAVADLAAFPTELTSGGIRRQAVVTRADVLGALAEYAASEAALQLQVAKQYPDIHLRPGYELDQDQNKWTLGLTMDLPILNQNQGPIAEAKARREEAAAKFNTVQARAFGEIDRAVAVYSATVDQAATAGRVMADAQRRSTAMTRMFEAGEVDPLVVSTAQAEYLNAALAQLNAQVQAQQALALLEDAVQSPLLLPGHPEQLEATARTAAETRKP